MCGKDFPSQEPREAAFDSCDSLRAWDFNLFDIWLLKMIYFPWLVFIISSALEGKSREKEMGKQLFTSWLLTVWSLGRGLTWEFAGNGRSQVPAQNHLIGICVLTRFPSDLCAHNGLRITALQRLHQQYWWGVCHVPRHGCQCFTNTLSFNLQNSCKEKATFFFFFFFFNRWGDEDARLDNFWKSFLHSGIKTEELILKDPQEPQEMHIQSLSQENPL